MASGFDVLVLRGLQGPKLAKVHSRSLFAT